MEKPKEENAAKDDVESNTRLSNNNSQGLVSVQSEATSERSSRAIRVRVRVRVRTRRRVRRRRDRVANSNNNSNIADDRNSGDRTSSLSSGRISAFRRFFPIRFVDSDSESRNEDSRLNGLPVAYPIQPSRTRNRSINRIRNIIEPISIRRIWSSNEISNEREAQDADEENNNNYKSCANYTVIYSFICALCAIVVLLQVISSSNKKHPVIEEDGYKEGNLQNLRFDNSSNVTTKDEKIEPLLKDNFTCYTDPMVINIKELEMFENGEDPSISRTYHLCPNTIIHPYDMDSKNKIAKIDYTSGMHFPLTLFRPNVSILCGLDGGLENNCTFQGGFSSIWIRPKVMQYDYQLQNTTAENTTIMGITFLGGSSGTTIFIANIKGSLTIRDCYFHNYNGLAQSIGVRNIHELEEFSLNVENSTFENNTYFQPDLTLYQFFNNFNSEQRRFIDYTSLSCIHVVSPFPKLRIHSSKFLNNHFVSMMDNNNSSTAQGDKSSITTALINMELSEDDLYYSNIEGVASLEVSNSHFAGNTGYSSKLFNIEANNTYLGGSENESVQGDMVYYNIQENLIMNNTPSNI